MSNFLSQNKSPHLGDLLRCHLAKTGSITERCFCKNLENFIVVLDMWPNSLSIRAQTGISVIVLSSLYTEFMNTISFLIDHGNYLRENIPNEW